MLTANVMRIFTGVHIEGPYLSAEKKGAHPPEHIAEFTDGFQSVLDMYGSLDNVSILTLAPEKKGAMEVIEGLAKRGITVSLGKVFVYTLFIQSV